MTRQQRGVLYVVWGDKIERHLARSIASLRQWHPELPHHVVRLSAEASLLDKARVFDFSPFDETAFLDADTVVLDRLDFAFAQAARHGVACPIGECPWARRFFGIGHRAGDLVEYNPGVCFFTRAAEPLFARWQELAAKLDSRVAYNGPSGVEVMPANDAAAFSVAVSEWDRLPFVLPLNWNFRPRFHSSWFGPIKIWHDYDDPPAALGELNAHYRSPDAVMQYHCLRRPA